MIAVVAAEPGDRQQQEEEGEAGDREEDPGAGQQRRTAASAWRWASRARTKATAKPIDERDQDEFEVLQGRRPVAVDVFARPVPAEEVAGLRLAGQRFAAAFLEEPFADFAGRRQRQRAARLAIAAQRPLGGAVLVGLRLRRGEELGDDLDREDAGDRGRCGRSPPRTATRPAAGRRARRASRRRGRAAGRAATSGRSGTVSAARSRSESQPERPVLGVDQQRVGDFDVGRVELRPHLGGRLPGPRQRRPPEVDVGDPHQRQPLQRPVGADEVLDELVGGRPSGSRPGSRTGRPGRPRAGSRSGRPS